MKKFIIFVTIVATALVVVLIAPWQSATLPVNGINTPGIDTPQYGDPPRDQIWIMPAWINIGVTRSHLGFTTEGNPSSHVTIFNARYSEAEFSITYSVPMSLADGYVEPPEDAEGWVTITDPNPTLMPREERDIPIILTVPEGLVTEDWEFWIEISEVTEGTVHSVMVSRWLVNMG